MAKREQHGYLPEVLQLDVLAVDSFIRINQPISLGIVCTLGDLEKSSKTVPQMLEDFKNHPTIKPLIKDGTHD